MLNKKKVLVAMSGGVDSSVAACLLKKANYEVIGITLKLFDVQQDEENQNPKSEIPIDFSLRNRKAISRTQSRKSSRFLGDEIRAWGQIRNPKYDGRGCCGSQGVEDARTVCQKLGIPFYSLNYEYEFKEKVIKYFCSEYAKGRTPNPCIVCNEKIKFGALFEFAKKLGADYIATGHYAKKTHNKKTDRYILKKGKDKNKDQSYFLFSLSQEQLKHTLFPLGDYTKEAVRKLAKKFGLKTHNKPESQDVCFIQDCDLQEFLIKHLNNACKAGLIVNNKGEAIGKHQGIAFYTVGQRKGLGCHKKPMYVIRIDNKKNVIVIGEEKELYHDALIAENVNWIGIEGIPARRPNLLAGGEKPIEVKAKTRYRSRESKAVISLIGKGLVNPHTKIFGVGVKVKFAKPQRAITPGQAVVFYDKDKVVGGGWITQNQKLNIKYEI